MNIELLTKDDLRLLKEEILKEIEKLVPVRNEPITKWLKSQEVRKILKCSPGSLQNLRINGQLNPKKSEEFTITKKARWRLFLNK